MHKVSTREIDLQVIRLVVTDVDGIWTAGEIFLDDQGREFKRFSAYDGLAVKLARQGGIRFAMLSARTSHAVALRARQLGIETVIQGSRDKAADLRAILRQLGLTAGQCLYLGDDLTDLPAFREAGVRVTVPHAPAEVRAAADLVTDRSGGDGAVRETVEWLLRIQGSWAEIVRTFTENPGEPSPSPQESDAN